MRPFVSAALGVAVLVTLLFGSVHSLEPVDQLVKVAYTKGAIVYPQPTGSKPYKFQKVPYFPGTKFYITFCGGPNVDRTLRVTKDKILYEQNRGPSGNPMFLEYAFATATLNITVVYYNPNTIKDTPVATSILELSALWDEVSDYDVQLVNDGSRKAAINGLQVLMKYLRPFARKNKLAACMAYLPNAPKAWANQPYNPQVEALYKYLKAQFDALKKVA